MVISMLITRMDITGLMNPETEVRACAFLNEERKAHALSFHKEKNRAQSVGAWLLFPTVCRHGCKGRKPCRSVSRFPDRRNRCQKKR